MNVKTPESYYSHVLAVAPPAYRLFADWAATAALIYDRFAKYKITPDDILWETNHSKVSDHTVTCVLKGDLSGQVRFLALRVELFLTVGDRLPTADVPAAVFEDALSVLRSLDPKLGRITGHRVAIGGHVGLLDQTFRSFLEHLVTVPAGSTLVPESLTLEFELERELRGTVALQRSLMFPGDPAFFFGVVTCNWPGDLDVRQAYERSKDVTVERSRELGLDITAEE